MKHFTVDEASEALGVVRPLAEELVVAYHKLRSLQQELAPLRVAVAGNGSAEARARLAKLAVHADQAGARIRSLVDQIQGIGAEVKDLELGLVDFPAERRGETVLLCWKVGEDAISFWHGYEEGFAGRKPLPL